MRKILIVTTTCLIAGLSIPAFASSDDDDVSCRNQSGSRLSVEAISKKIAAMGYQVRKVESDDGCFEVKAVDAKGSRFEFDIDPVSGDILKTEKRS